MQFTINPFQNLCLVTWWAYFWKALCSFEKSSFFPYRFLCKECIAKAEKDCIFVGHLFSFSAVRISLGLYQKKYSHNLVKEFHTFMYFGHSVNWKKKKSLNIVLFSTKNVNIIFLQFLNGIYFTPYSCRRRYHSRHQSWCVSRTMDTQWRHKSKLSEKLGRCGRQNMLRPYLKIWEWEWIFGRAVKAISSLGVRSPWCVWRPYFRQK